MEHSDYDNFYDVLNVSALKNEDVFVMADDAGIPDIQDEYQSDS